MAYKITEECINCGACDPECPNEAIFAGDEIYEIDPDKCSECIGAFDESILRAVTHLDVNRAQVVEAGQAFVTLINDSRQAI